ncbi:hypothetical protein KEM52_001236 [Ascosphaera acerosa]|nr:hypothetical protein KEM52_001236 [Ascosphaera acerosa]
MSSRPASRAFISTKASAESSHALVTSQPMCCTCMAFPLLDKAPRLRSADDWPRWYLHVCAATRCVFLKWDDPLALPEPTHLDREYKVLYSAFWQKLMSTVDEKFLLLSKQYDTLSAQVNLLKWLCEDEAKSHERQ